MRASSAGRPRRRHPGRRRAAAGGWRRARSWLVSAQRCGAGRAATGSWRGARRAAARRIGRPRGRCSAGSRSRRTRAESQPVAQADATLSRTIAPEMSGCFSENVPPKPQHSDSRSCSMRVTPGSASTSATPCTRVPISRRAAHDAAPRARRRRPARGECIEPHVEHVYEEFGEFVGAFRNRKRLGAVDGIVGEQRRPMVPDHAAARAGRHDHGPRFGEQVELRGRDAAPRRDCRCCGPAARSSSGRADSGRSGLRVPAGGPRRAGFGDEQVDRQVANR